jgi:hypothetical protein
MMMVMGTVMQMEASRWCCIDARYGIQSGWSIQAVGTGLQVGLFTVDGTQKGRVGEKKLKN